MSDITVQFGFVDDGDSGKEPAMGIKRAVLGNTPIFAIPLSSAYKYADGEYLMKASFAIANFLGMFPDQFLINRIADLILNYLPDLIKSAPAKHEKGQAFAEGELRIDGERIEQFEAWTGGGLLK